MTNEDILLGYEVPTGNPIFIKTSHLIACGITQLSGKTTTLEACIKRSGETAIVFKTKVGESGFTEGTMIPPFFKERSDWQYVAALLEATLKERLKFERSWIIDVCKNANSLLEVKANIDKRLAEGKLRELSRGVYTTLQAYFELVLPQLQYANFSRTLSLEKGINIMDLERFSEEIQSLVIRSVLEVILGNYRGTIVVMPEAWKFLPQGRGNPCKQATEKFIRQGAANRNFLWIDSQDMSGVDKIPLKQVSTWILGLQQERNEVEHTLDQISLPAKQKPKVDEVMTLPLGHFYLVTPEQVAKVYVCPSWLDHEVAKGVALGKIDVKTIKRPEQLISIKETAAQPQALDLEERQFYLRLKNDLSELRKDFFSKIEQQQKQLDAIGKRVMDVQSKPQVNVDEIVSLVLQKMPLQNKEEIVNEIVQRIPRMQGTVTYEVTPLEKLQKDFLVEANNQIITLIKELDPEQQTILRYAEALGKGATLSDIMDRGLFVNSGSGGSRTRIQPKINDMVARELLRKDAGGHYYPNLKAKIQKHIEPFSGSQADLEQLYNHIVFELLPNGKKGE